MTHHSHAKLLKLSLLLLFSSLVQGQSSLRALQDSNNNDEATWRDKLSAFFTDDRCLRTEKATSTLKDLSNWMSKLDQTNSTRLLDLTLPGTHNSAAFDLTTELNENDPDYSTVEKGTFNIPDAVISQWICGYALTQSLSLSEQLQAGIRYLDLRLDYDSLTQQWRGFHFLWGLEMLELLQPIATFAKEHPKEIIVLQFGTIYNPAVTAEQKADYANTITNLFAGQLIPTSTTDLANVTIGGLQDAGTTILAVVRDNEVASQSDVLWDDQTTIENTYFPTDNVDALKSFNQDRLQEFASSNSTSKLFQLQWILTPSTAYIQENPLVGNLYELSKEANKRVSELKSDANPQLGNTFLMDYVEVSPLFQILDLERYSDGAFVQEAVPEQNTFTAAAKIGLGVGVTMLICGLCCLRKWCKSSSNNKD